MEIRENREYYWNILKESEFYDFLESFDINIKDRTSKRNQFDIIENEIWVSKPDLRIIWKSSYKYWTDELKGCVTEILIYTDDGWEHNSKYIKIYKDSKKDIVQRYKTTFKGEELEKNYTDKSIILTQIEQFLNTIYPDWSCKHSRNNKINKILEI